MLSTSGCSRDRLCNLYFALVSWTGGKASPLHRTTRRTPRGTRFVSIHEGTEKSDHRVNERLGLDSRQLSLPGDAGVSHVFPLQDTQALTLALTVDAGVWRMGTM